MDGLPLCGAPAAKFWHLMPCRWGRPQHHCERSEAIIGPRNERVDCFASLAMTATGCLTIESVVAGDYVAFGRIASGVSGCRSGCAVANAGSVIMVSKIRWAVG